MRIVNFLENLNPLPEVILAGFSGGADSTALLLLLQKEVNQFGIILKAVHFEHGLRKNESLKDAEWCKKFCEVRGIEFNRISLNVNSNRKNEESLETAARRLRLEKWYEFAEKENADGRNCAVALGHHADDRIENIFLRLIRGSNCSGLTSMRPVQQIGNTIFLRPLLPFRRFEIESFLKSQGVNDWRTDKTNSKTNCRRNIIRNIILPELYKNISAAGKGILNAISSLESDADFIESSAMKELKKIKGSSALPILFLKKLHPALQSRILRYWLTRQLGEDIVPDKNLILRLNSDIKKYLSDKSHRKNKILIPFKNNIVLKLQENELSLYPPHLVSKPRHQVIWNWRKKTEIEWNGRHISTKLMTSKKYLLIDKTHNTACFDRDLLPDKLIIRGWKPGDKLIPFASVHPVKLKKLFEDRKIPCDKKLDIPVVCLPNGEIIWLPSVRRANFANISDTTAHVLYLQYKQENAVNPIKIETLKNVL